MSRFVFDSDWRSRLRSVPAVPAADRAAEGRSSAPLDEETGHAGLRRERGAGAARVRRQREDPCGRRGLTGREFRRRRSR